MKKTYLMLFIIISLLASSCSNKTEPQKKEVIKDDEEAVTEEAVAEPSGEAIFTYSEGKIPEESSEVVLTFSGDPVQIGQIGFIKLKGIVMGEMPVALVEIGGRGAVLRKDDEIGGFAVAEIGKEQIRLIRKNVGTGLDPVLPGEGGKQ